MSENYEERKRLTFEQAEGAEPLPTQLRTKELSAQLRARLWEIFYDFTGFADNKTIDDFWEGLLYRYYVDRRHQPADEFNSITFFMDEIKAMFLHANYIGVLGFIQWILRRQEQSSKLHEYIEAALQQSRAAYRVYDRDTIVPIGSDAEGETLKRAFADVTASEFRGARSHLREAGSKLTTGDYAGSIREVLEPDAGTLAPALGKLEKSVRIHGALRAGFSSLYGFTSDEKGIRHPLLLETGAQVDETDALYMLGSCAAFVSYLINKAWGSGLIA